MNKKEVAMKALVNVENEIASTAGMLSRRIPNSQPGATERPRQPR